MSAYRYNYIPKVEEFLGRRLKESEILLSLPKYNDGWHPRKLADLIREADEKDSNKVEPFSGEGIG